METESKVMDLAVACVTSVKNATGLELDMTQDTLPILDHYATLVDSPREELISLLAPMCGAYFGELVRRHFSDGEWTCDAEETKDWRLRFRKCNLSFNPIGVALEVLARTDAGDWAPSLRTTPATSSILERALGVYGSVDEADFFTFCVRFEGIDQAYRALLNNPERMDPHP